MAEVLKSTSTGVSLTTTLPSHNHIIGPDLTAGENIGAGDACIIGSNGLVLRALAGQANAAAAINDVQSIAITGDPTDGTYVLGFPTGPTQQLTPAQPYNADAATIQAALQALSTVGAGNMLVTGNYPNFTVTAAGALAGQDLDLIFADPSLLVNPAAGPNVAPPNVVVTKVTAGQPAGTGAAGVGDRVRGFAMIATRTGQPISLYDAVIMGYSDQLLTPGQDLFLSSTVPGGLSTTPTYAGQAPIAFAVDNTRAYYFSVK